ncbi:hypothetical protein ACVWXO_005692 [Bradyrhizobium sp. LM2.7]
MARSCIRSGASGRFFNVVDLVNRLETETRNGRQGRLAEHLTRMDFIVLDELGYLPFAQSGGQLLFHLVSRLYERASVIVTTNLAFGEWPSDHRAARPIVETGNDSWRFKSRDDDHATRARLASAIPASSDETSATSKPRRAKGEGQICKPIDIERCKGSVKERPSTFQCDSRLEWSRRAFGCADQRGS